MALLQLKHLGKTFHQFARGEVRAVDDVSLSIEQGTLTVLTGPSGSGKTTLLSLIGAIDRPSQGELHFDSRNLAECSDVELARVRRRIGFVFQDFALLPRLSVVECITYSLLPCGVPRATRNEQADELLERLGIAHCRDVPAGQLSGGERQRVAIARALIVNPKLFLADEPTSNLDEESEQTLVSILQKLQESTLKILRRIAVVI